MAWSNVSQIGLIQRFTIWSKKEFTRKIGRVEMRRRRVATINIRRNALRLLTPYVLRELVMISNRHEADYLRNLAVPTVPDQLDFRAQEML